MLHTELLSLFYGGDAESAAEKIGQLGGVQDILSLLRQFKDDPDICQKCCSTLWSLCVNGALVFVVKAISR